MGELKLEQKLTFEGSTFKPVPVPAKRQDGINSSQKLFIDEDGNTLLVCNDKNEVLLKIIGDCLTVVPLD